MCSKLSAPGGLLPGRACAQGNLSWYYERMTQSDSLTDHFLVAMPQMDDERFKCAVIYVCEHTHGGSLGITINKPVKATFVDVLTHLGCLGKQSKDFILSQPMLWGGPCVRDRGFVLHRPMGLWKNSFKISGDLSLTTSQDILQSIGFGKGPIDALIAFGCVRWEAGQLERELADNVWLTVPASNPILFDCPFEDRWSRAAITMGIDFKLMAYDAGHA